MTRPCPKCAGSGHVPDPVEIGAAAKRARKERRLTQRMVASRARCAHTFVCLLEKGQKPVTTPTAKRVLAVLGVRP